MLQGFEHKTSPAKQMKYNIIFSDVGSQGIFILACPQLMHLSSSRHLYNLKFGVAILCLYEYNSLLKTNQKGMISSV